MDCKRTLIDFMEQPDKRRRRRRSTQNRAAGGALAAMVSPEATASPTPEPVRSQQRWLAQSEGASPSADAEASERIRARMEERALARVAAARHAEMERQMATAQRVRWEEEQRVMRWQQEDEGEEGERRRIEEARRLEAGREEREEERRYEELLEAQRAEERRIAMARAKVSTRTHPLQPLPLLPHTPHYSPPPPPAPHPYAHVPSD